MKKKLIVIIFVLVTLVVAIAITFVLNAKPTMIGRAIVSDSVILIAAEDGQPIQLNARNENVFSNVSVHTGDLIEITHEDYMLYSDPAQMVIFKIEVLENGTISDVPENTLNRLKRNNWLID